MAGHDNTAEGVITEEMDRLLIHLALASYKKAISSNVTSIQICP